MRLFPKERDLSQPPREVELRVEASALGLRIEEVEIRLDHFLGRYLKWRSRTSIQELVREGLVSLDASTPDQPRGSGTLVVERRPGRRLRHGSRVVIEIPPELRMPEPVEAPPELVVLYEDDAVLVVDKPPMMPVHPAGRHLAGTLIQHVHARYGGKQVFAHETKPRLCHRIDRETSGLVVVGKNLRDQSNVMLQFENREVVKEYLAIVRGAPTGEHGTIDWPIGGARSRRVGLKMACLADGLEARTDWRVVERHPRVTLIACRLHTGRQHQIRVHMEAIGYPIVGDKLYGVDDTLFDRGIDGTLTDEDLAELGLPRHALHNHRIVFTSPATRRPVEVVSPLPDDMRAYLAADP